MPTATDRQMIALDNLTWPVSFRYVIGTPFGFTQQEITTDIPELEGLQAETAAWGFKLWQTTIAKAISHDAELEILEYVMWKLPPAVFTAGTGAPAGGSALSGSPREHSGQLTLHTGHMDKFARRDFYVPRMPNAWQSEGVLNDAGQRGMYGLAAVLAMGFNSLNAGGPLRWLIHYTGVVDAEPSNLLGVAFRAVQFVRVKTYCMPAREGINLLWPEGGV